MAEEVIVDGLIHAHYGLEQFLSRMFQGTQPERQQAYRNMVQTIAEVGRLANQLKTQKSASQIEYLIKFANHLDSNGLYALADKITETAILLNETNKDDLIVLADYLDGSGFHALADKVDKTLQLIKTAEDYGFCPGAKKEEETPPIKPVNEGSLSTRYCPDHIGVSAVRIDEHTYQCPLDGKEYNYETGYVNYEGQGVPGGSVAAQTPMESNYGGIPMRFYDSRSDVLSRLT